VKAKEAIESRLNESFKNAKGNAYELHLKPGLPQSQLSKIEERLAVLLPNEVRELLTFTSGFNFQPFGQVDFSAKKCLGLKKSFLLDSQ